MSLSHEGRNTISLSNSASKTLMENWVEERGVDETLGRDERPMAHRFRDGNQGLLTINTARQGREHTVGEDGTTTSREFKHEVTAPPRAIGTRREQLARQVREYVVANMEAEEEESIPEMESSSIMKSDFTSSYVPKDDSDLTQRHEVYGEQRASFWQAELASGRGVSGISAVTSNTSPFKKNAMFTTPVELATDGIDR